MFRQTDDIRREERGLRRAEPLQTPNRLIERFSDEVDRLFDDFGFGRIGLTPRSSRSWLSAHERRDNWMWAPEVEVFSRNNELVIHADLPGLTKQDVHVDVAEDRLTIQGERKREREEERDGVYRSERNYGTFYREVPLPPGAMADQAKARFDNGVLEITMPAAPESTRRRRLEIVDASREVRPVVQK